MSALSLSTSECQRLKGGSIRACQCRLKPHDRLCGGGWADCPIEARRPLPKYQELLRVGSVAGQLSGEVCDACGGINTRRTGTCIQCLDCYSTGGCG